MRFRDRQEAGRLLADALAADDLVDPLVLALPRGGVPVAYEIATRLGAPLEVFVARKVGAPGHKEFGIGAVAEGGAVVTTPTARELGLTESHFGQLAAAEQDEVARRVDRYREGRPLPPVDGRDVVLVDDGLATGATAEAALIALRGAGPRRLVLAVPTCSLDTAQRLQTLADRVVCVITPSPFYAVGQSYERFGQTTDDEVADLLARSRRVAR